MNKEGRPTKYKTEYVEQVFKLCLLGLTDKELAEFFEIDVATLNNWKIEYPEFFESIKKGKQSADAEVAKKLYHRALGYEHPEDKIFLFEGQEVVVPTTKHYAPDPTAAIFWLKNRQPKQWRDKQEVEATTHNTNVNYDMSQLTAEQLTHIMHLTDPQEIEEYMKSIKK